MIRIYNCDNTIISSNTTIGSGEYNCNLIVPQNINLTIESGAVINFKRNASFKVFGNLNIETGVKLNFEGYAKIILDSLGTLTSGSGSQFTFNDHSIFLLKGEIEINQNNRFVFNDDAEFEIGESEIINTSSDFLVSLNNRSKIIIDGMLNVNENGSISLNDNATITVNGILNINENCVINFPENTKLNIYGFINITSGSTLNFSGTSNFLVTNGTLSSIGTISNPITFNFTNSELKRLNLTNVKSIELDYTTINSGRLKLSISPTQSLPENITITQCTFNDCDTAIYFQFNGTSIPTIPTITNCIFNNCFRDIIKFEQVKSVNFTNNIIDVNDNAFEINRGITIWNCGDIDISNCIIYNGSVGIDAETRFGEDSDLIETISANVSISNCSMNECESGILFNDVLSNFENLIIFSNDFDSCSKAITINDFNNYSPIISNNRITDFKSYALSLTNGGTATVKNNTISTSNSQAVNPIGIYLSQVSNPVLLYDSLTTDLSNPGSGIVSVSSNGYYRSNVISGYYNGVELGNSSSPYMALNEIYHNKNYGIYVSTGSNPKLNKGISGGTGYPLSGYNRIYENGTSAELTGDAEIYINTANIQLSKGCNTIADDRYGVPPYDHRILMNGEHVRFDIIADSNYWGNHPVYGHNPSQRFGSGIRVRYAPYDTVACNYFPNNSDKLLLTTTTGSIVDTLYSDGSLAGNLSPIEAAYSDANQYFYSGDYSDAENIYKQIIYGSEDSSYSIDAYNRLYLINKYQDANSEGYENLKQYYESKLSSIEDTSILLAVNNLIDMCKVSKNEYEPAINNFDQTAQNNPGTDISLYNEINAFTTALLIDSINGLGKAGKYSCRDISEYLNNVSELLKTRGKNVENEINKLIPTKFILYQNYPNPFNPLTTIKFAIPKTVNVELKVFDILGREVKTLVNESRNPGYYEVQFNASNFASGVYFYRLRADDYIKTSKMLLIK